jgi:phage major head subunit gpT-like protein
MSIAGNSNLAASQATFEALFQNLWNQPQAGYVYKELCMDIACPDSKYLRNPVVASYPRVRQWSGSKLSADLRAFEQTIEILPYEATISLPRLQVTTDKTGAVEKTLSAFLSQNLGSVDDLLITNFLANTWTSYDGVALLNASHTFSSSTGNNLTTSALSFATYKAGKQAMALFADESGRPLNIYPTHLVVGPAQERVAKEIIGADRPVAISSSGAQDAVASVVGAVTLPNVFSGDVKLIVSSWVNGNQWFMAHMSPGLSPFIRAVHREFETQMQGLESMSSDQRFWRDLVSASLEADMGFGAGAWQCIYGSVTA